MRPIEIVQKQQAPSAEIPQAHHWFHQHSNAYPRMEDGQYEASTVGEQQERHAVIRSLPGGTQGETSGVAS